MTKKSKFFSEMPDDLYFGPVFDEEEIEAVSEVMRSLRITQLTSNVVNEFEEAFADYVGAKEAIALNSGTASLQTSLAACDIGPGDEVIVPAFTFIGTVGPVMQQRATPVFADIDQDTFCLSVEDAASKITPRTKAIMPVDLFGHPADLDPIRELADEHNLVLIEDACQGHGAKHKGGRLGRLAQATCFSFQETKNMTTGEGGMITTDDPELANICREIRHQGERSWGVIERVGYNYRLTALQAAIGLVQLKKLDKFNGIRRQIATIYTEKLSDLDLQLPKEKPYAWSVFHVYSFLLPKKLAAQRDKIVDALLANRVPAAVAYPSALYTSPVFHQLTGPFNCPVAEDVSSRVITLPTAQSVPLDLAKKIGAVTRDVIETLL